MQHSYTFRSNIRFGLDCFGAAAKVTASHD